MINKTRKAFYSIELLLVIGIFTALAAGTFAFYKKIKENNRVFAETKQTTEKLDRKHNQRLNETVDLVAVYGDKKRAVANEKSNDIRNIYAGLHEMHRKKMEEMSDLYIHQANTNNGNLQNKSSIKDTYIMVDDRIPTLVVDNLDEKRIIKAECLDKTYELIETIVDDSSSEITQYIEVSTGEIIELDGYCDFSEIRSPRG